MNPTPSGPLEDGHRSTSYNCTVPGRSNTRAMVPSSPSTIRADLRLITEGTLTTLPQELLLEVLFLLSPGDLARVCLLSKILHRLANVAALWKAQCELWGFAAADQDAARTDYKEVLAQHTKLQTRLWNRIQERRLDLPYVKQYTDLENTIVVLRERPCKIETVTVELGYGGNWNAMRATIAGKDILDFSEKTMEVVQYRGMPTPGFERPIISSMDYDVVGIDSKGQAQLRNSHTARATTITIMIPDGNSVGKSLRECWEASRQLRQSGSRVVATVLQAEWTKLQSPRCNPLHYSCSGIMAVRVESGSESQPQ